MPVDIEARLISKTLTDRNLNAVLEAGITPGHFVAEKHRQVFTMIRDYTADHGVMPTWRRVEEEFTDYQILSKVKEPLSDCIARVKKARAMGIVVEAMDAVAEAAERQDPQAAQAAIAAGLRDSMRSAGTRALFICPITTREFRAVTGTASWRSRPIASGTQKVCVKGSSKCAS